MVCGAIATCNTHTRPVLPYLPFLVDVVVIPVLACVDNISVRFDILDAIMNPEPPVKVKRQKRRKARTGDSLSSSVSPPRTSPALEDEEAMRTKPVLLRPNLPPKKVRYRPTARDLCLCA